MTWELIIGIFSIAIVVIVVDMIAFNWVFERHIKDNPDVLSWLNSRERSIAAIPLGAIYLRYFAPSRWP